jgi:hypothetical protein
MSYSAERKTEKWLEMSAIYFSGDILGIENTGLTLGLKCEDSAKVELPRLILSANVIIHLAQTVKIRIQGPVVGYSIKPFQPPSPKIPAPTTPTVIKRDAAWIVPRRGRQIGLRDRLSPYPLINELKRVVTLVNNLANTASNIIRITSLSMMSPPRSPGCMVQQIGSVEIGLYPNNVRVEIIVHHNLGIEKLGPHGMASLKPVGLVKCIPIDE